MKKRTKWLALFIVLLMLVPLLCACNTAEKEGNKGDDKKGNITPVASKGLAFEVNSDEGGYSVVGIGECTDTKIVIPATYQGKPVTNIGPWAFENCSFLTSITIPDSVTSFDMNPFLGCTGLIDTENGVSYVDKWVVDCDPNVTSVTLRANTVGIGEAAFYNCSSLTNITIPDSVMIICANAFSGCTGLIDKENGVSYIDRWVVNCDENVASVTLRANTIGISDYAFNTCDSLKSITIPDGVTSIGLKAFRKCYSLASVTMSNSVTRISSSAFYDCRSLTNIEVDVKNLNYKSINGNLYSKDGKKLIRCAITTTFDIPNSVTSIGSWAFSDCNSLTCIEIPDSVTSIDDFAFSDCNSLESITIGDSVTSIGAWAFSDCSSLTCIEIPDSVTSIDDFAFSDCKSLASITIGDGVASIGHSAFSNCDSLTRIEIPDSVKNIGGGLFSYCDSLTNITIGDGVASIRGILFNCDSVTSITIGDSVTSIDDSEFSHCRSLANITIGNSVTSIGKSAFEACSGLNTVYYAGTAAEWEQLHINPDNNQDLTNAPRYYYSDTEPTDTENLYWHYVDGVPTKW